MCSRAICLRTVLFLVKVREQNGHGTRMPWCRCLIWARKFVSYPYKRSQNGHCSFLPTETKQKRGKQTINLVNSINRGDISGIIVNEISAVDWGPMAWYGKNFFFYRNVFTNVLLKKARVKSRHYSETTRGTDWAFLKKLFYFRITCVLIWKTSILTQNSATLAYLVKSRNLFSKNDVLKLLIEEYLIHNVILILVAAFLKKSILGPSSMNFDFCQRISCHWFLPSLRQVTLCAS